MRKQVDCFDIDGTDKAYVAVSGYVEERKDKTIEASIELDITDYIYESSLIYLHPSNAREMGRKLIELANKTEEEFIKCQLVDKK